MLQESRQRDILAATSHSHDIFLNYFMISNHFRFNWTTGILVKHVIWSHYYNDHDVATIKTTKLSLVPIKFFLEGLTPKSINQFIHLCIYPSIIYLV